jgi:cell division transport system permease protein
VFGKLIYLIRRAMRNMLQSPILCTATVGTVTVSLCILTFFAIIVLNVQQMTRNWSREVQVVAYLDDLPSDPQLSSLITSAKAIPEVLEVVYVTKEQAFEGFRERLGDDAVLLDGLKAGFLPASLRLTLRENVRNRAGVQGVVDQLKKKEAYSDFRYGQDWLERFESMLNLLRIAGAVLGGFLLFATLFIVANTIKLTVYARREELEVMSLVGGTSMFIKSPFLIEGALQGVAGGGLAIFLSYLLFTLFLHGGLETLFLASGVEEIVFLPPGYQLLVLTVGILLGILGSLISLRKFVRI